jgi:predicted RNA binding protein YcfA (HicA-like mRNA interferase family)
MSRLPRLNAQDMAKVLELSGFSCVRSKGGHFQYRHSDGRNTTVPFHGSELLPISLIKRILSESRINEEDYRLFAARI